MITLERDRLFFRFALGQLHITVDAEKICVSLLVEQQRLGECAVLHQAPRKMV